MDTMMALRAHFRGGPETLVFEEAPRPQPAPGEALVAVHAAAITFAELTWDLSWTDANGADRTPVIPSHEVSGTVAALGAGVTDLAVGDEVYGLIGFARNGAAAQYVTVPAADLAAKPRSAPHVDCAALPLAALTAWQALVDQAGLTSGERILVHGGAGGVGVYAVQLAATLGARVTATAAGRDAEFVQKLGAHQFIDFTTQAFDETDDRYDLVLDTVGGSTLDRSYGVVRPGGRLVTLGAPPDADRARELGIRGIFFVVRPDPTELRRIAQLVDDGELRPIVAQTFPLAEGQAAFASANQPRPPGKTVLVVR